MVTWWGSVTYTSYGGFVSLYPSFSTHSLNLAYTDVNSEYEPLKTDFAQRTPGKYLVPFTISFIGMASSVSLPEGLYSAL